MHQRNVIAQAADNWQGMERICGELVRQTGATRLRIVLSDKLVRYACFPWREELRNAQEDLAMAVLNFDDVYGANASADWHFAFSDARPGRSRLSVAMPKTLFAVLQDKLGQSQCKVASIQTTFTAALHTYRKQLEPSGWLINLEEGRLTLGCWTDDSWSWVYSVHADIHSPAALLARVQHEIQLASTSLKDTQLLHIYVHAPVFANLPLGTLAGVRFVPLQSAAKAPGPKYAFALLGVAA